MTIQEIEQALANGPTGLGECDRCHCGAPLYSLPDTVDGQVDGADWQYCGACLRSIVNHKKAGKGKAVESC